MNRSKVHAAWRKFDDTYLKRFFGGRMIGDISYNHSPREPVRQGGELQLAGKFAGIRHPMYGSIENVNSPSGSHLNPEYGES